jgi:hypothetical protein
MGHLPTHGTRKLAGRKVAGRGAPAARRGITLLEVLVAMLVLTVGVLGMAAIIPLGKLELAEGDMSDNASTVGRWAFRDLSVRGYLRPDMWADPVTGRPVMGTMTGAIDRYSLTPTTAARVFTSMSISGGASMRPPYVPIVIDPLMLAPANFGATSPNATALTGAEQDHRALCNVFPYSAGLGGEADGLPEGSELCPVMPRFTLRTMPPSLLTPTPIRYTMRYDLASRIFRGSDDLTIDVPEGDLRVRPQQEFAINTDYSDPMTTFAPTDGTIVSTTNSAALNAKGTLSGVLYRKYLGTYSWFFIVEPSLSEAFVPVTNNSTMMMPRTAGPYGAPPVGRQHRVWVVVCQQRDLRPLPDDTIHLPGENGLGERMVWVDFLDRGTVRIRASGLTTEAGAMKALDLRTNQWFAVLGRYEEKTLASLPNSRGQPQMRYVMEWYRVTGVADRAQPDGSTGTWFREATVAGRDFFGLGFTFFDEDDYAYKDIGQSFQPITGWGVIVKGVRGVYEKTMYDEGKSSWSM